MVIVAGCLIGTVIQKNLCALFTCPNSHGLILQAATVSATLPSPCQSRWVANVIPPSLDPELWLKLKFVLSAIKE